MRTVAAIFVCFAIIGAWGCSSNSAGPTTGPKAVAQTAEGKSLVGKWRGKVEVAPNKKDDAAAKAAAAMAGMFGDFDLEIKEGNVFTLAVMGIPTEGSIVMKGNEVTMTPKTILGKTIDEFKKMNEKAGKTVNVDAANVMTGTTSTDGETITIMDAKKPETQIIFRRNTDKPREIGASTVQGEEAALVGDYKTEIDPKKLKPEDKEMTEAMLSTASLTLFHDNTFTMNMVMGLEGIWKATGGKVTLTLKKMNGIEEKADSGNKPILMTVQGTKLVPDKDGGQEPPFNFVKK